jgi:hypothetical protein
MIREHVQGDDLLTPRLFASIFLFSFYQKVLTVQRQTVVLGINQNFKSCDPARRSRAESMNTGTRNMHSMLQREQRPQQADNEVYPQKGKKHGENCPRTGRRTEASPLANCWPEMRASVSASRASDNSRGSISVTAVTLLLNRGRPEGTQNGGNGDIAEAGRSRYGASTPSTACGSPPACWSPTSSNRSGSSTPVADSGSAAASLALRKRPWVIYRAVDATD